MKRIIFTLIIAVCCLQLLAQKDWNLLTNTSFMRDLVEYNGEVVTATWGGLSYYSPNQRSITKTMTIMDGIKGNDIYALSTYGSSELMVAIKDKSVDRFIGTKQDVSLSEAMGLASLTIFAINAAGNKIFIGSDNGLTVFQKDENISFPVLLNSYNTGYYFRIVNAIAIHSDGYIYLGTDIGITRTHADSLDVRSAWRNYSLLNGDYITSIDVKDNIMAVATNNSLFYMLIDEFSWAEDNIIARKDIYTVQGNAGFNKVQLVENGRHLQIYAVFGAWDSWRTERNDFLPDPQNRSILITNVTPGMLAEDDPSIPSHRAANTILYWGDNSVLTGAPATSILVNNNDVYIATWGDGLYHLDRTNRNLIAQAQHNSIQSNYISSIAVDYDNVVWFADGADTGYASSTATKGVASFDLSRNSWNYYTANNSGLISNNMTAMAVDHNNNKWFGTRWVFDSTGWENGVSVFTNEGVWKERKWDALVHGINCIDNLVFVSQNTGVHVLDANLVYEDLPFYTYFQARAGADTYVVKRIENIYYVGTSNGLNLWRQNSMPYTSTSPTLWNSTPIDSGIIYSIEHYNKDYYNQIWFATSSYLYMYDITYSKWYRYDTDIKRRVWNGAAFENEQLYYSNEDRLWGSEAGTPSCLIIDSFDRVWIGTSNSGLAMYDIKEDRFYNYKTTNSPLVSNSIMALAYQAKTGLLYISTPIGVMTTFVGVGEKNTTILSNFDVFPNPFKPEIHPHVTIQATEGNSLPINSYNECRIFDFTGQLVRTMPENSNNEGSDKFIWDGKTAAGKNCAPGIYFYLIQTSIGDSARGKIVLIR